MTTPENMRGKLTKQMKRRQLELAAPDLLAALKAIIEFADNGSPVHPGAEVITDAREAIAKAEGRTG